MKIAVMGAGALGGYFGGRLAEAGHEVWLIARGPHLEAIRSDGLRIISPKGDVHLTDIRATGDPAEVGAADVVFFMVKNRDVEGAAEAIKPMLGEETFVVTCQNGITAWERLGSIIGPERVIPGVARIPGEITRPGVITHTAPFDSLSFAEPDGTPSDRTRRLFEALEDAGTFPVIVDNILHDLWTKFCGQSTLASLTTITGLDIGPLRETPETAALFRDAIQEAYDVGKTAVPDLPGNLTDVNWEWVQKLPAHMHASMLDDLRNGKPLELEYLSGDVVRLGRKHGVPTPIHRTLYAVLKPIADSLEQG